MKKYLLFFGALLCMANMCIREESENYHRTIKITNNADYPVYIYDAWLWEWYANQEGSEYPWGPRGKITGGWGWDEKSEDRVNPGETNTAALMGRPSRSIETIGPNGHIKIFFIDAAIYDQIPIGSPIPNEALLDSRVYSLEDLRAIGFHIHYPLE